MDNSEQAKQRRREKILARASNEPAEEGEGSEAVDGQERSVFQRYRSLKQRIEQEVYLF